jgi:hypothetical protein
METSLLKIVFVVLLISESNENHHRTQQLLIKLPKVPRTFHQLHSVGTFSKTQNSIMHP